MKAIQTHSDSRLAFTSVRTLPAIFLVMAAFIGAFLLAPAHVAYAHYSQLGEGAAPVSELTTSSVDVDSVAVQNPGVQSSLGSEASAYTTVYIARTSTNKIYHLTATCSQMKNPNTSTLAEALANGYRPCQDCAVGSDSSKYTVMKRLYNPYSGEHLYTKDENEYSDLGKIGWRQEGLAWYAPESGSPVYRLYNPYSGDHHFTMDENEYNNLAKIGWRQEGVGWNSAGTDGEPLYRGFNPYEKIGTHHYTKSKEEMDQMVKNGWRAEGTAWYGAR